MTDLPLAERSVELVRAWIDPARTSSGRTDPAAERLAHLLQDPAGLDFTVGFVDRVVRPEDSQVAARNLRTLARHTPKFLPTGQRLLLKLGAVVSFLMPGLVVSQARRTLRRLVGHLVIDARPAKLGKADQEASHRRRPPELQPARRGRARRGRSSPPSRPHDRAARARRRRLRLGQGVRDRQPALHVGVRRDRRPGRRTAAAPVRRGRLQRRIHQPRHGGVPRPRPHHRGVHQGAGRLPRPRGRHRPAGLPARLPRRHAAAPDVGGRTARQRRGTHQGARRQGRQPGHGTGRCRDPRVAAGHLGHQAGVRHQLQAHSRVVADISAHRRGEDRRRRAEPLRHRLRLAARR